MYNFTFIKGSVTVVTHNYDKILNIALLAIIIYEIHANE